MAMSPSKSGAQAAMQTNKRGAGDVAQGGSRWEPKQSSNSDRCGWAAGAADQETWRRWGNGKGENDGGKPAAWAQGLYTRF